MRASKSDLDRTELNKDKTGVIGAYAINPVNQQPIPIWISDYVLISYGTGAIMAVPAHDTRDFEFATKFNLPVICIMRPDPKACAAAGVDPEEVMAGKACWVEDGEMMNSSNDEVSLNGLHMTEAKQRITEWLHAKGIGEPTVNFKLRDWLFSRQRYWGEPFPLVHMEDGTVNWCQEDTSDTAEMKLQANRRREPPLARAPNGLTMPTRSRAKASAK